MIGVNSYIELDAFKSWALARGLDISTYPDTQIESAIVVASSDYIDTFYRFKGIALDESQTMQLPTDTVTIQNIEKAAAQATYQQLTNKLFKEQTGSGIVESSSVKVGDITKTQTFKAQTYTTYPTPIVDRLLSTYTLSTGLGLSRG